MNTDSDKIRLTGAHTPYALTRIFISYSRKDQAFARKLAEALGTAALDVWIDVEDIPAGKKWSTAIQEGLQTSEALIVILSPNSMQSRHVEDEWQYFLDRNKPVIPVLLSPTEVHFELSRLQYVNFYRQKFNVSLLNLLTELRRLNLHVSVADYLQTTRIAKPTISRLPPENTDKTPTVAIPRPPELSVRRSTLPAPPPPPAPHMAGLPARDKGALFPLWALVMIGVLLIGGAGLWAVIGNGALANHTESAPPRAENGSIMLYLIASNHMTNVNIRQWDSEQAPVVHVLRRGQEVRIYGINPNAQWLYGEVPGRSVAGWIKAEAVRVSGDTATLPLVLMKP